MGLPLVKLVPNVAQSGVTNSSTSCFTPFYISNAYFI